MLITARDVRDGSSMSQSDEDVDAIAAAAAAAIPLPALTSNAERYAPLLDAIGDAQFVCLGECTHGTKEFYKHRAAITKLLIEQKGFSVMLVEGDWPAGWRLDRYISAAESTDTSAEQALGGFEGFPRWMWRNSIIANLAEELRARNERLKTSNSEASEARDTIDAMRSAGAVCAHLPRPEFHALTAASSAASECSSAMRAW